VSSGGERGQSTVEWIGLTTLIALVLAFLVSVAGIVGSGIALAGTITTKLVCAVNLADYCGSAEPPLVAAYGPALAGLVAATAPEIRYEPGMHALPVDYHHCRDDACANGDDRARISSTETGEPVVAFTHVIDCRAESQTAGADCSGSAAGNVYVQYWLYYPGSATGEGSTMLAPVIRHLSEEIHEPSYHPDDWESVQYRVHPDGSADVRASAHHGYGPGWEPAADAFYRVSGGSHAGTIEPADYARMTPPGELGLIPLEPIAADEPGTQFAITPPWYKHAWLEPEYAGTD
jgi:hypothetical protein